MNFSILNKFPLINLLLNILNGSEIIVNLVLLALSWLTCGMANTESKFIIGKMLL